VLYGAHVSSAGGISNAIDRIEEIGGNAMQIFTQSPRMWRPTAHTDEELERFRARRKEAKIGAVVCHALYLVNLASRDKEIRKKSRVALRATLETARAIEADAVVFHVGSHLGYGFKDALRAVKPALQGLLELTTDTLWLCMENTAGAGGTIGRDIGELAMLCERLGGHRRLGVCIDSCHWWASGVDVGNPEALDTALHEVDEQLGLERLRCLHVNDAAVALGANRDRHEVVARGVIGNGLATFLGHPAVQDLPAILETWPKGGLTAKDVGELRRLNRLGKRRRAAKNQSATRAKIRNPARSRGSS
jgi:deoxyribonuclease-4